MAVKFPLWPLDARTAPQLWMLAAARQELRFFTLRTKQRKGLKVEEYQGKTSQKIRNFQNQSVYIVLIWSMCAYMMTLIKLIIRLFLKTGDHVWCI